MRETDVRQNFFVIPHTHWEGAVFKTRAEYLFYGLDNITKALKLLENYPNYRFVLDQACYVKPYLEKFPEQAEAFKKFIKEGRLEICGGLDVMPDVNMPCGESFVRQVLYGKGYFRKELGTEVTVGWQLDTFGHHAQMPQLLKLAGYTSFWFFRGVPDKNTPVEFLWEGIDGTRIPAFWLSPGYAVCYGSPKALDMFIAFFREKFDALAAFYKGKARMGLAGADVCEPEDHLPELVESLNKKRETLFFLRLATPSEYEKAAAGGPGKPIIKCEMNPVFQGTYSSRIELKQFLRETENLLLSAEKFGALLKFFSLPFGSESLWDAWEPVLFNQAHDLMSGVMTDKVYEDTVKGYVFSMDLAGGIMKDGILRFSSLINTQGKGMALVIFNTLGWKRTDAVHYEFNFAERNVKELHILDSEGKEVVFQTVSIQRFENETIQKAEVAFIAQDVPAMGHSVYRVIPVLISQVIQPKRAQHKPFSQVKDNYIENALYKVVFDFSSGEILKILTRPDNRDVLGGPGNVVVQEKDEGDLWELYRTLDGGSLVAMKDVHPVPQKGKAGIGKQAPVFSSDWSGIGTLIKGSVFSEFRISHTFGSGFFTTRVRLYRGSRRIEINTQVRNNSPFVRYRALFPTIIRKGKITHEIPFGAIERPDGIEFPAQNWVDYSGADKGVALLNRGIPGNNVAGGTIMLSLMRSTRIVTYGIGGGYEEGASSDTGLEMNKTISFDYALVPHAGNWSQAGIYRDGLEFTNPLMAFLAEPHKGSLPAKWGFLEISHPGIVVSALKPGDKGTVVLRAYEAAGQPAEGTEIKFCADIVSAEETNLMEDPGRSLEFSGSSLRVDFRPFEIKTLKLKLKTGSPL